MSNERHVFQTTHSLKCANGMAVHITPLNGCACSLNLQSQYSTLFSVSDSENYLQSLATTTSLAFLKENHKRWSLAGCL